MTQSHQQLLLHQHQHQHQHAHGGCASQCCGAGLKPEPIKKECGQDVDVDVEEIENNNSHEHIAHHHNFLSINTAMSQHQQAAQAAAALLAAGRAVPGNFDETAAHEQRKQQISPVSASNSNDDSGHGSPRSSSKSEVNEEEEVIEQVKVQPIKKQPTRFYRPFEDHITSNDNNVIQNQNEVSMTPNTIMRPTPETTHAQQWQMQAAQLAAASLPLQHQLTNTMSVHKRVRTQEETLTVDITQTKRIRDNNGKIVVYPGIRESTASRVPNPHR